MWQWVPYLKDNCVFKCWSQNRRSLQYLGVPIHRACLGFRCSEAFRVQKTSFRCLFKGYHLGKMCQFSKKWAGILSFCNNTVSLLSIPLNILSNTLEFLLLSSRGWLLVWKSIFWTCQLHFLLIHFLPTSSWLKAMIVKWIILKTVAKLVGIT